MRKGSFMPEVLLSSLALTHLKGTARTCAEFCSINKTPGEIYITILERIEFENFLLV
jgi:hypothetical protein